MLSKKGHVERFNFTHALVDFKLDACFLTAQQ